MSDYVGQARRACGLTHEQAGKMLGMSGKTYGNREANPDTFTIKEFFALYDELDDFAKGRLWDFLEEKAGR